jgi:hypothetical protein
VGDRFLVAVVAVVPVVLLENRGPWVSALPVLVGILLGIIFESKRRLRETARAKKFAFLRTKQEWDAQTDFAPTRSDTRSIAALHMMP